jgi:hypothetical protein
MPAKYRKVPPKTRAGRRIVTLPRSVVEELAEHLRPVGVADAWVFTAGKGGVLRPSNFRVKVWLPAVRAAGLAPLRPHDLRHTAVALWIAAGANPKEVSVRAGHTSVAFTLDRYGHLFESHDDELRDRLDAMLAQGLQAVPGGTVVELPAAQARPQRGPRQTKQRRRPAVVAGLSWAEGVRRQGLEPRTVALRGHCSAN